MFFFSTDSSFKKKQESHSPIFPSNFPQPDPQTHATHFPHVPRRGVLESCVDQVVAAKVPTLERLGGGSVRCMLAELFKRRGPVEVGPGVNVVDVVVEDVKMAGNKFEWV